MSMNIACVLNISVFSITYTHNIVWIQKRREKNLTKNPKKNDIQNICESDTNEKHEANERKSERSKRNEMKRKLKKPKPATTNICEECIKAAEHKKIR